jgi:DNA repair exonuclease SbcCD ATPase subunit
MRILSITARNYRIHRDITVGFDPSRNLIGGPNETGKSTLAEAMHRALFLRAKTGGNVQRSMCSEIHMGKPEVSLVFEAGGQVWTIEKRFSGPGGTTRLASDGGLSYQGDEAETKLAQLIHNEDGTSSTIKQLETQWAHLWVWQGKAGENAAAHAGQQKDLLVQRLQKDGLAAVMQSDFDQQVREKIQASNDEIFTKTGKPMAGSMLDSATKALTEAGTGLARAESQDARHEAAVADQNSAAVVLAEAAAALPGLREKLSAVKASLSRVTELRAQEEKESILHQGAVQAREQLAATNQQILDLRSRAAQAMEALLPAEAKLSLLADQEKSAHELSSLGEAAHRSIAEESRSARLQHDLGTACVSHFEKSAASKTLAIKANEVEGIHGSHATAREALAKLPDISGPDLESLRRLDGQLRQAESALAAIAARVELISSELPIQLDEIHLAPGESRVITEAAELAIGTGTRLRIQPGGGTSLAESRQRVEDARAKLTRQFDQFTVGDLEEAVGIVARRQVLDQQLATIKAKLQALGAKTLPADLSAATAAREAAAAEVERRRSAIPNDLPPPLPDSSEAARIWQAETREVLDESERKERTARQDADARRDAHQQAAAAYRTHKETTESARQKFNQLKITADALEANHGDAPTRARALEKALEAEAKAKTSLDATLRALAELNPETLEADQTRFARSITQQEEKQRESETKIAVARNVLVLDGSQDPEADLVRARARLATVKDEHAREDRRAKAIALLQMLFSESQSAISEQVTQPIADRITGYLERLFEPGVRAVLELTEDGAQMLKLTRPGTPTFPFDSLSGGAKEQVAAAVRLAMAEILAADHGGCLPLVFDDAFAFADPDRVQALQSMLDLAAIRGLQVIVLTCTPADYIALGAKEIRLSAPLMKSAATAVASQAPADLDSEDNDGNPSSPPGPVEVTGSGETAYLQTLRALGGSSGNQTLRNTLGWDETTYTDIKDALINRGLISPGKGRGGSVSLADSGV